MLCTASTHWLLSLLGALAAADPAPAGDVKVTVVAILATDRNTKIDADLKEIAERVRKEAPHLTGFRTGRQSTMAVKVGGQNAFPLIGTEVVTVKIEAVMGKKDASSKIRLTVKPPMVGDITYTTACEKFFPIVTRYETKDKERLIIAIMVEHCEK